MFNRMFAWSAAPNEQSPLQGSSSTQQPETSQPGAKTEAVKRDEQRQIAAMASDRSTDTVSFRMADLSRSLSTMFKSTETIIKETRRAIERNIDQLEDTIDENFDAANAAQRQLTAMAKSGASSQMMAKVAKKKLRALRANVALDKALDALKDMETKLTTVNSQQAVSDGLEVMVLALKRINGNNAEARIAKLVSDYDRNSLLAEMVTDSVSESVATDTNADDEETLVAAEVESAMLQARAEAEAAGAAKAKAVRVAKAKKRAAAAAVALDTSLEDRLHQLRSSE